MHFVGLALEPFEKTANAVPAIVLRQFLDVGVFVARFTVDDKLLVGLGQILERNSDIDFVPRTGAHQVALRFAHLFAAKNANRALGDRERTVRDRFVQVDRDRPAKAAALRTGAEGIVEAEKAGRWRTNVEIAMRAMPAGRIRMRVEG